MSDIRKFFTPCQVPRSPRKTALSDERLDNGSPKKKSIRKTAKAKPVVSICLDDDSDVECPIPKTLKSELKKKKEETRNSQRVVFECSAEQFFDQSIGEQLGRKEIKKAKKQNTNMTRVLPVEIQSSDTNAKKVLHSSTGVPARRNAKKAVNASSPPLIQPTSHKSAAEPSGDKKRHVDSRKKSASSHQPPAKKTPQKHQEPVYVAPALISGNKKRKARTPSPTIKTTVKKIKSHHPTPPKALPPLPPPKRAELPWVDKYKPQTVKDLVGQGTPQSPTNKLLKWLREWAKNNLGVGGMVKKVKPGLFAAQTDGTAFKAALLSGPPGIGKTTSAVLCCQQLGLKYVEMNASDARNKKLLDDKIVQLLECRQVNEFFTGETPNNAKHQVTHVLIMDEVDGMSGNQDRAGIAELISMIKTTKIPIICICNDRQSQKIRSLANHCFDLRFNRPNVQQIRARMMTIKAREKINITPEVMDQMIEASNQDVRQCVYSLQLYAAGAKGSAEKKDISVNIFEAARKILSKETSIAEKQELYFGDYSIMPLFVQENYPNVRGEGVSNLTHLKAIRRAANCLAEGDLIEKQIRSNGAWNLLPGHGMMSCALPAAYLDGHMTSQLQFPSWLGKNSSASKRQRMMRQLTSHAHLKITGNCHSIVTDYLPVLRDHIYRPLVKKETEGVKEVIDVFKYYDLTRDDTEAINELGVWPGARDLAQNVNTKTKSALTRNLNKESRLLPYSVATVQKGRKKAEATVEEELDEEGHVIERKIGAGSDDEAAADDDEKEKDEENPEVRITTKTSTTGGTSKRGGAAATATRGGRGRGLH